MRSEDSQARDAAGIDSVTQFRVAVDSGMAKISHSSETALQILPSQLRTQQHSLTGRFLNRQQLRRHKAAASKSSIGFSSRKEELVREIEGFVGIRRSTPSNRR